MKDGFKDIIGKRIAAVVVAQSKRPPQQQVFLVFDDHTRFEIYGGHVTCCSGVDRAAGIGRHVQSGGGEVVRVHSQATHPDAVLSTGDERQACGPPQEAQNLESLLAREVNAWKLAKRAIARANGRPRKGSGAA